MVWVSIARLLRHNCCPPALLLCPHTNLRVGNELEESVACRRRQHAVRRELQVEIDAFEQLVHQRDEADDELRDKTHTKQRGGKGEKG
jgi:hypothetical protein